MVDRGDVGEHHELLLVPEERRDVGEHRAVDVDDRLPVTLDEHGSGELLDDRRRNLIIRADRGTGSGS